SSSRASRSQGRGRAATAPGCRREARSPSRASTAFARAGADGPASPGSARAALGLARRLPPLLPSIGMDAAEPDRPPLEIAPKVARRQRLPADQLEPPAGLLERHPGGFVHEFIGV